MITQMNHLFCAKCGHSNNLAEVLSDGQIADIGCRKCGHRNTHCEILGDRGPYRLLIAEDVRQVIIMGLAKLSMERPGWDDYLNGIALRMDNNQKDADGKFTDRAEMYDSYRRIWVQPVIDRITKDEPNLPDIPQSGQRTYATNTHQP